uniref:Hsp70 protein n=1 Tax=Hirondellea gigas TaxID=1518452 RepID=A0A6A7G7D9_9CRUS
MSVVGIDFGTGFSQVAVVVKGGQRVDVITNDVGNRSSPSAVSFDETEVLTCEAAISRASKNPKGTIFDIRSLLGKRFSEISSSRELNLKSGEDDTFTIEVKLNGKLQQVSPEKILTFLLRKLMLTASDYINSEVSRAVIAVPRSFSSIQRQSLLNAAEMANLQIVQLIHEPTAALLAYGFDRSDKFDDNQLRHIMTFDIGSSSCDVSIFDVQSGFLKIRNSKSTTSISGNVLDKSLMDHFVSLFKRQSGIDISSRPKSMNRLSIAVERLKCVLSRSSHSDLTVDSLCDGVDIYSRFTRARFETLCYSHFSEISRFLHECLKDAKLGKDDIYEVLLVGGITNIPKIDENICSFFNRSDVTSKSDRILPAEVIAQGAAIQAGILSGEYGDIPKFPENCSSILDGNLCSLSVSATVLSISVELSDGSLKLIIPTGTILPFSTKHEFTLNNSTKDSFRIRIFEGELINRTKEEIQFLEEFTLSLSKVEDNKISVGFSIGIDGVLRLSCDQLQSPVPELSLFARKAEQLSSLQKQFIQEQIDRKRLREDRANDTKFAEDNTANSNGPILLEVNAKSDSDDDFEPEIALDSDDNDSDQESSGNDSFIDDDDLD